MYSEFRKELTFVHAVVFLSSESGTFANSSGNNWDNFKTSSQPFSVIHLTGHTL